MIPEPVLSKRKTKTEIPEIAEIKAEPMEIPKHVIKEPDQIVQKEQPKFRKPEPVSLVKKITSQLIIHNTDQSQSLV